MRKSFAYLRKNLPKKNAPKRERERQKKRAQTSRTVPSKNHELYKNTAREKDHTVHLLSRATARLPLLLQTFAAYLQPYLIRTNKKKYTLINYSLYAKQS